MTFGNKQENVKLAKHQRVLEINTNIGIPEGFPSTKLNLEDWGLYQFHLL